MHNYAGNPDNFPVSVPLVDDADLNPPTASVLDPGLQALADRTAYLKKATAAQPILNWNPTNRGGGPYVFTCSAWDGVNGRWLVATENASTNELDIQVGTGEDDVWTPLAISPAIVGAGPTVIISAVLKDPSDASTYYVAVLAPAGGAVIYKIASGVSSLVLAPSGGFSYNDVALGYVNGYVVAFFGSTTANSAIYYSNDQGATWASTSVAKTILNWRTANNGLAQRAAGTCVGAAPVNYGSTNGTTWTDAGITGTVSGEAVQGLCAGTDSAGAAWYAVTYSGGNTRTRRSSDGATWEVQSTLTTVQFVDVQAFGQTLGGMLAGTNPRAVLSLDGGATWYASEGVVYGSTSFARMAAAPTQLLMLTDGQLRTSMAALLPAGALS